MGLLYVLLAGRVFLPSACGYKRGYIVRLCGYSCGYMAGKSVTLRFRASEAERDAMLASAAAAGLPFSEWVRRRCSGAGDGAVAPGLSGTPERVHVETVQAPAKAVRDDLLAISGVLTANQLPFKGPDWRKK